jgi:prepilin-type N-terminal cleavage/methylation domain-containing protein
MKLRSRKGFTLLEMTVTIVIGAMALFGFGMLMYDTAEMMHISWMLRDIEEFGHYYTNEFQEKVRSGTMVPYESYGSVVTKIVPPCEAEVYYIDPTDQLLEAKVYEFEYNQRAGMPVIRVDDNIVDYPYFPPAGMDSRDEVSFDAGSFRIYENEDRNLPSYDPAQEEKFRMSHIVMEFSIIYRRYNKRHSGYFEKELTFSTAGYMNNENWPVLEEEEAPEPAN